MSATGHTPRQALLLANATRVARARIKHDLATGEGLIDEVLCDPPPCCARVPVFDALQWVPGIGVSRAKKLQRGLFSETLPLSSLGNATRSQLLERLHKTMSGVAQ